MKTLTLWVWLKARPEIWATHAALVLVGLGSYLFFRFPFNFARVHGREHVPKESRNVLIVSNHTTMFDSFFVGAALYFPSLITKPGRPPINFADQQNYFTTWYIRLLLRLLRTEPVPSRTSSRIMQGYESLLKRRNLLVFYQGTRSHNLTKIKAGPAYAVATAETAPLVVPVYHEGAERIFRKGGPKTHGFWRWMPLSLFRKPSVIIGEPIPMDDLRQIPDLRGKIEAINDRIVESILALQNELRSKKQKVAH